MESISRLQSMLESARDLTLDAARDASALKRPSREAMPTAHLKKLLDSRQEREVLEGLRRVIAHSHRHPPSSSSPPLLFSSVLKNIASPSIAVKKLVYIYLLAHAESEPDTALLAINTIQKTLSASDPHLRALALRVMSGIRVPVISQIVSLAIKKGCTDVSPLVRKAAALAIPKCWRLNPSTSEQLVEYLSTLLGDKQYVVAGAAVAAYMGCCPERIDLLHKHYRGLLRKLVDMDEWSQLATLRCMLIYARRCFPQRTKRVRKTTSQGNGNAESTSKFLSPSLKGFYDEPESGLATPASGHRTPNTAAFETEEILILDPDLVLLLKAAQPLLQSRNSAVIVAVTRLYLYLAPPPSHPESPYLSLSVGPLVALLRNPPDIQLLALYNIVQVALILPQQFLPYTRHFLLRSADPPALQSLKLELLTILFPYAPHTLQSLILTELAMSCRNAASSSSNIFPTASSSSSSPNQPTLLTASVRALGRCALSSSPSSTTSTRCLSLLLSQLNSPNGALVAESLTVIRHIIQADPAAHIGTVTRLAKNLDAMTDAHARATVIWLVGEFAGVDGGDNIAADVLRLLCKRFAGEEEVARAQIVLLGAKVYVHFLNGENAKKEQEEQQQQQESNPDYNHDNSSEPPNQTTIPDVLIFDLSTTANRPTSSSQETTHSQTIPLLWTYLLHLIRYDPSYDLRSRSRLYKSLLSTPSSTQLASLLLLAPKAAPSAPSPSASRTGYTLGSASLILAPELGGGASGVGFAGYEKVPEWVGEDDAPDGALREEEGVEQGYVSSWVGHGQGGVVSASQRLEAGVGSMEGMVTRPTGPVVQKSLDDWLAEDGKEVASREGESGSEDGEDDSEEDEDEEEEERSTEDESDETEEESEESSEDEKDERAKLVSS